MKRKARKPTDKELKRILKQGLDSSSWLVLSSSTGKTLHVVNIYSGKERHLPWQEEENKRV